MLISPPFRPCQPPLQLAYPTQNPLLLRLGLIARLRVAESELSAQQEKNVLVAEEYSELIKNLEERQREDSQKVKTTPNKECRFCSSL